MNYIQGKQQTPKLKRKNTTNTKDQTNLNINNKTKDEENTSKEFYFKLTDKLFALQEPVHHSNGIIKNSKRAHGKNPSGFRGSSNLISVRVSRSK
jgi:hypothetical protein